MKLRFVVDSAVYDRVRAALDVRCVEPPTGRRIADVYMDTPDDELAGHGVALRYRRRTALDAVARKPWKRQERRGGHRSLGKLGIKGLKQRLDATFAVRVERWTWRLDHGSIDHGRIGDGRRRDGRVRLSLDRGRITTGTSEGSFTELRVACPKRLAEAATRLAIELGVTGPATTKARERGLALLGRPTDHASPG